MLDAIRRIDRETPFFIYAGSNSRAHKMQAQNRGAQGTTNDPQELFDMITGAVNQPIDPPM